MKKYFLIGLGIVLALSLSLILYGAYLNERGEFQIARRMSERSLELQGAKAEKRFIRPCFNLNDINLFSKDMTDAVALTEGRIVECVAPKGSFVRKGDTLFILVNEDLPMQIKQAEANILSARAEKHSRENQYKRYLMLKDKEAISAQQFDETKAKYDAAVAQAKAAKSQYDLALDGARSEDKAAAAALVLQADGAIQEVDSYLNELYLVSPADGIISSIYPRQGELVGQGSPVATVTDLSDLWFTFNIREDELHGMDVGEELTVRIPALDGKTLKAKVNYMAVRESYATWKATKETDQYDAKTFEVRAVPEENVKGLRPGMTVLVVK